MPQKRAPVGKIRRSSEGEVEDILPGNLSEVSANGSRWVHINATITTPPEYSSLHFSITLHTSK